MIAGRSLVRASALVSATAPNLESVAAVSEHVLGGARHALAVVAVPARLSRGEIRKMSRGLPHPTSDDVPVTSDGERLDSREKVLEFLAQLERERPGAVLSPALTSDRQVDWLRITECFDCHGVEYLIVGGVGAQIHGATRPTSDFDSLPDASEENLDRLAQPCDLGAHLRLEGLSNEEARALPVQLDGGTLARMDISTWSTDAGDLDDIIASKEWADRPKERAALDELHRLAAAEP